MELDLKNIFCFKFLASYLSCHLKNWTGVCLNKSLSSNQSHIVGSRTAASTPITNHIASDPAWTLEWVVRTSDGYAPALFLGFFYYLSNQEFLSNHCENIKNNSNSIHNNLFKNKKQNSFNFYLNLTTTPNSITRNQSQLRSMFEKNTTSWLLRIYTNSIISYNSWCCCWYTKFLSSKLNNSRKRCRFRYTESVLLKR